MPHACDSSPRLQDFVTPDWLATLIRQAKLEDMGPASIDITSQLFVPAHLQSSAAIRSRKAGILAGEAIIPMILAEYDAALTYTAHLHDGQSIDAGGTIGVIQGPLRSILSAERVVLNFLTHLGGIATLTAAYVKAAAGTRAGIYDTRKTIPGLRGLHKYAIVCGGGKNHRMGLFDAVLVKDNHIAHHPHDTLGSALQHAIQTAQAYQPAPSFIEVEVDDLVQLESLLRSSTKPSMILLDNMTNEQMTRAVQLRDELAPAVELEASGGVNLQTVAGIARTGVDRIAVGALTHSAPALDIGLDITMPSSTQP